MPLSKKAQRDIFHGISMGVNLWSEEDPVVGYKLKYSSVHFILVSFLCIIVFISMPA